MFLVTNASDMFNLFPKADTEVPFVYCFATQCADRLRCPPKVVGSTPARVIQKDAKQRKIR